MYIFHLELRKVKKKHFESLNIFAQNIDCGDAVLTSTHNLCFGSKNEKNCTPVYPGFTIHVQVLF